MHSVQLQVLCNILKGSILLGHHILTVNKITEVNIHLKTKWRLGHRQLSVVDNWKMVQQKYVPTAFN
jgi:hypothetical protein